MIAAVSGSRTLDILVLCLVVVGIFVAWWSARR
jgi:hypothetical protein